MIDKTTIIHIASEVVVLTVVVVWFNKKTQNIYNVVKDISRRLEEQENLILNHEKTINELIKINQDISLKILNSKELYEPVNDESKNKIQIKEIKKIKPVKTVKIANDNISKNIKVTKNNQKEDNQKEENNEENNEENLSETESEMDEVLKNEIAELLDIE
jgi:hypothetical protein